MAITKELKNMQQLEAVGFDHKQAETLADIIAHAQADSQQDLKDFIRNEINGFSGEIKGEINGLRNEMNLKFSEVDKRFGDVNTKFEKIFNVTDNIDIYIKAGQYDLLIKIFAIVTGTAAMLFAALKLFG